MISTLGMLEDWYLKDKVIGLCFDTTASNSGIRNGCCSLMEKELKRAVLWCACRHHFTELHIKHAWQAIRNEKTVGPEDVLFKKFQAEWGILDRDTSNLNLFKWPEMSTELSFQAETVLKWTKECILKNIFPREDYRELIELVFIYLGGGELPARKFFLRQPGAMHHARFMSKSIYLMKMELMTERISFSVEERRQVHKMAQFIALFYAKYFLRSRIAVFSPLDDLKFLSSIISYSDEDPDLAIPVITSIKRHLWYLTEELVVLSLFNEELASFTRSVMAKKLFSTPRPDVYNVGKPKFPTIDDYNLPFLSSLIGPRSWLIFALLGLTNSQDWLQLPPKYWELMFDYRFARNFCVNLQVVNDCAERAIKLVEDFSHITQDEEQFQFLLQSVEEHRKKFPSFTQNSLLNL